jgi:two-component system chemotaxis response regulator CheB
MAKLRVLVVEDSLTVRHRLCDVLGAASDVEVIGQAGDGKRAIELCRELRPDVVSLDMMLPIMTGVAATEYIMAYCPTPILIVSASMNRGELFRTYDALAAGAVDVLEKPRGDEPDGEWERRYLSALRLVARIKVITHPRGRDRGGEGKELPARLKFPTPVAGAWAPSGPGPAADRPVPAVLALGASTGGPGALLDVLSAIPLEVTVPIAIVLHLNEPFGEAFASWLDGQTTRRVAYAREGEPILSWAGRVAMAPPGRHLIVEGGRFRLSHAPERNFCRPSVDVLFESLARECGAATAAGLLTGMGRDGAEGLLAIRRAGGYTIAQDEASSVVYGMPREAALLGAATVILPLREIGPALGALGRARPAAREGA